MVKRVDKNMGFENIRVDKDYKSDSDAMLGELRERKKSKDAYVFAPATLLGPMAVTTSYESVNGICGSTEAMEDERLNEFFPKFEGAAKKQGIKTHSGFIGYVGDTKLTFIHGSMYTNWNKIDGIKDYFDVLKSDGVKIAQVSYQFLNDLTHRDVVAGTTTQDGEGKKHTYLLWDTVDYDEFGGKAEKHMETASKKAGYTAKQGEFDKYTALVHRAITSR